MTDEVALLYDDALLGHAPEGWDPGHPERIADLRARLRDAPAPRTDAEQADQERRIALLEGLLETPLTPGRRWGHPERPERLEAVRDLLLAEPIPGTRWVTPEPASDEMLKRVHDDAYLAWVESLRGRHALLDPDTTAVSPGSVDAARLAAGAAVDAVTRVVRGTSPRAMALVRPPGHHALPGRAMGFCLYANAAVAAAHARAALGCERVLLIDWDAHHGNGAAAIFDEDPSVTLFDTHLEPAFYPGTGHLAEVGRGAAEGTMINVPLPFGSGDAAVFQAFESILVPLADRLRPDLVLVSAGFDGHRDDLNMTMTEAGFAHICAITRAVADRHADGRLALVLEGGYGAEALSRSVHACVRVLAGGDPPPLVPDEVPDPGMDAVAEAARFHLER